MTVKELIAALQEQHPDDLVVLAKDAEGNGYSPLDGVEAGFYAIEGFPWQGEFYAVGSIWTEADGERAVCLDPVH